MTPADEKLALLIVERDAVARQALVAAAQKSELFEPIDAVDDGDVALDFIWDALESAERRAPDLIVSALWLPRLNGIQLSLDLRSHEETRAMFIALLAPADHPLDRSAAETAGCDAFLVWPTSIDGVVAMLKETAAQFLRTDSSRS